MITAQLRSLAAALADVTTEGFDIVVAAHDHDVVVVPSQLVDAPIGRPPPTGGSDALDVRTAGAALHLARRELRHRRHGWRRSPPMPRHAGFSSIWLMDHYLQIPQVGREWDDMLEAYTTLGLSRRSHDHGAPRHAVHGDHLPQRGGPRQDRRHPRRPVRRTGDGRVGHRVVRARAPGLRVGVPATQSPLQPPGGRLAAAPAAVGQGITAVRRAHGHRAGGDLLSAARCRTTSRSSSAAPASVAPCASWPATPTPATSSATPPRCATRSPSCIDTAPTSTATPPR